LSEGQEVLLGEIPVSTRLSIGSELLKLYVTNTRIIVVHVGKRGVGGMATASTLGGIGSALEDIFKGGRESISKRHRERLSLDQLLSLDKDNFPLSFDDVVRIELDRSFRGTWITVLTRDDKFQFSARIDLETVAGLLRRAVGDKVQTH
jgi:hypothetical protein